MPIACIGGAVLDRKYRARGELAFSTSNPVNAFRSFGGVARNVAENLTRLGHAVRFSSMVGDDEAGRALTRQLDSLGADVSQVLITKEKPTAEYAAILDTANELVLGIADMEAFALFGPAELERVWPQISGFGWVFADCNLPAETLADLIDRRRDEDFRLAIDPVSTPKSARVPQNLAGIDVLFLNQDEAAALLADREIVEPQAAALALLQRGAGAVVLTLGSSGYVIAGPDGARRLPAVPARPVDITGAGDAMIAGTLSELAQGRPLDAATRIGALLAALTTESNDSVRQDLDAALLAAAMARTKQEQPS